MKSSPIALLFLFILINGCNLEEIPDEIVPGKVSALDCAGATVSGSLTFGQSASGVSVTLPYSGGNGEAYSEQTVASTGVAGLKAVLSAGNFNIGSGSLLYEVTGTPSTAGTAVFALNIGGKACSLLLEVQLPSGIISELDCTQALVNDSVYVGQAVNGVFVDIPYTGGNGGSYSGQTVPSTGVTGLNLILPDSIFASGAGILRYTVTGTPSGAGTAVFVLDIGGKTCSINVPVLIPTGVIGNLDCMGAVFAGSLVSGVSVSNTTVTIPYTGGNGGMHSGQTVNSTGVTGLTATLSSGNFMNGDGTFSYTITGTPSGSGTASFALNIGGKACTLSVTVQAPAGTISSLNCTSASVSGSLISGQSASGVSVTVSYAGGNGGTHSGQTVTSTGVTGLTATLASGSFSSGSGNLTYSISGTPSGSGTASFALNIGGKACTLTVSVTNGASGTCNAKISATETKVFMCHNLGVANTSADPFTPSWEINGGYWQWGQSVQAAAGPSGSGSSQANEGSISGWNTIYAANGSWTDNSKTSNDPCPTGFRVPARAQWDGVISNNTLTNVGTNWINSITNYSTGKKFGNNLFLPAAGGRNSNDGLMSGRGDGGLYWSSTESGTNEARYLYFYYSSISGAYTAYNSRLVGLSVRCIAE